MIPQLFHPDELRAQTLAGFDRVGGGIYPAMPDQHRAFFAALPYLFVATLDDQAGPSPPCSAARPDFYARRMTRTCASARRAAATIRQALLLPGKPVGALGLDFSNRRRNRANGTVGRTDKNRVEIVVHQSFGNCPQYIQRRELYPMESRPQPVEHLASLDAAAQALIRTADTSFVASGARNWRRAASIFPIAVGGPVLSIWKATGCGCRTFAATVI